MTTPTAAPVPSTAPQDLLFNAEKLDEAVNSAAPTFLDRFGRARKSLTGVFAWIVSEAQIVLGGLGYLPPVAYGAGIAVTNTRQTVTYSGVTFAANADAIPFTTSGVFESDKFRVVQGATYAELSADGAAALLGWIQAGDWAMGRNVRDKLRERVSVFDGLSLATIASIQAGSRTIDVAGILQQAIDSFGPYGGDLIINRGQYLLKSQLRLKSGVRLIGEGGWAGSDASRETATSFFCSHTGAAMVNFKGAIGCALHDINLHGDQAFKPQTAIIFGRSSAASAGQHDIRNVSITGFYQRAAIYLIAAENVRFSNVFTWNFGGDALYGVVISTQDIFALDNLFTSSCVDVVFHALNVINTSPSASAAGIFLQGAQQMGSLTFIATYLIQNAGAYVRWTQGVLDNFDMIGPVTFHGLGSERFSGGDPLYGFDLTAASQRQFVGFTASGVRFDFLAGANHAQVKQDTNVFILNPDVTIQPPEAFPYAVNILRRSQIKGGRFSVGRDYEWTPLPFASGWANRLGAPYVQAGYRVTPFNKLEIRARVAGPALGLVATLPDGYRPPESVDRDLGTNEVQVNQSGNITLVAGNPASVDLTLDFSLSL